MMTPDEMIAVIQAYKDGKEIQLRWHDYRGLCWITINPHPNWHFDEADYRIKPEPKKPREWWGAVNDNKCLCCVYPNEQKAKQAFHEIEGGHLEFIHVREVLPEETTL